MANLTFDGKRLLFPGGGVLDYVLQSGNVLDFNDIYYINLSGNPDLSGNKIVTWKMYLESNADGHLFHLGINQNNMFVDVNSSTITAGNFDKTNNTSSHSMNIDVLTGKTIECVAAKNTNDLIWFSCDYFYHNGNYGTTSGSPDQNTSRIGANGNPFPGNDLNILNNAYVWDIKVDGIGYWYGFGSNSNTNSAWVDTIGSNNGTIVGSPDRFTVPSEIEYTYNDWFLPSRDEFQQMVTNLYDEGVGNFQTSWYWTSSEDSSTNAFVYAFSIFNTFMSVSKSANNHIAKPIRIFTDSLGAYGLRDPGPAGGLIFYISGTTYYEASLYNLLYSTGALRGGQWSNVTSSSIGTTGTSIGDGQSNTTSILNQSGHIYGAAYLCDKYGVN